MAITAECEDRMHLSKRGRRWHRCFIRIEVASKHFLRSILVSILINMNMIVVIEIHHWIILVFFPVLWKMYMMWQLPESMKHSQADLYLETYQVLDLEMSRLREIQRWQASAASKVYDLSPSFIYCLQ